LLKSRLFFSSFQSSNTVGLETGRIFGYRKTPVPLIAKLSSGAGAGRKMENQPTEGNLENGRENDVRTDSNTYF